MSDLVFAKGLSLPRDAVTQKFAFLGRSSSGKTYAAKRLVESLLHSGAQVVVIDPVGIWHGLRAGEKFYDIPVLGGLHGDLPISGTSGGVVARIVCERATSVVIDVSQMHDAERTRFATAFAQAFFALKKAAPSAVHLVLEEAQELLPQNPQPGEQLMLHELQRIAKIGRNFGIGLTLISQRPQEVSKKALNQSECVLAFQMTGPQERKALEYWLSDRGIEEKNLGKLLPTLAVGHPLIWSPSWLKVNRVVEILPIGTSDTGKTPEVGAAATSAKLRPIDVEALRAELAVAIEQAEDNDPKVLKDRIYALEQQLRSGGGAAVFDKKGFRAQTDALVVLQQDALDRFKESLDKQGLGLKVLESTAKQMNALLAWGESQTSLTSAPAPAGGSHQTARSARHPEPAGGKVRQTTRQLDAPRDQVGSLAVGESNVLAVLAATGSKGCTKAQVALQTGYRKASVRSYVGRLISHGYAAQREGTVWATDSGKALVPSVKPLPKGDKLVKHLIATLPAGESKTLQAVYGAHPHEISKEQIANETKLASHSVRSYVGRLVTRQLVVNKGGYVNLHAELGL
jgi:hypothetical protein